MQVQDCQKLQNFYSGGQIYISECNKFGFFWNNGMVYKVCLLTYSIQRTFTIETEEENETIKYEIITYCIDEDQSILMASAENSRLYLFNINTAKVILSFVQEPQVRMFYIKRSKILICQNINNKIWLFRNINEKIQKKTHLNVQHDTTIQNKAVCLAIENPEESSIIVGFENGVVIVYDYEKYDFRNINQLISEKHQDPLNYSISFLHYINKNLLLIVSGCIYIYDFNKNTIMIINKVDDSELNEINIFRVLRDVKSKNNNKLSFIASTGNSSVLQAFELHYNINDITDYKLYYKDIKINGLTKTLENVKEIVSSKEQFIITDAENRIHRFLNDLLSLNAYYCDNHYIPENIKVMSLENEYIIYNHPDTLVMRKTKNLTEMHYEIFSTEILSIVIIKNIVLVLDTDNKITKFTISDDNNKINVSKEKHDISLTSICEQDVKGLTLFNENGIKGDNEDKESCYLLLQLKLHLMFVKLNLNTFKIENFEFNNKSRQNISVPFNEDLVRIADIDLININFKEKRKSFKLCLIKFEKKIKLIKLKHKDNVLYSYKILKKFEIPVTHKRPVDYFINTSKFTQTNVIEILTNNEKRLSKHTVLYKDRKLKCKEELMTNTMTELITSLSTIKMGKKTYNCSVDVNFNLAIYKESNKHDTDDNDDDYVINNKKNVIKIPLLKKGPGKSSLNQINIYSHVLNELSNSNDDHVDEHVKIFLKDNKETLHLIELKDVHKEVKQEELNREKENIVLENELDKLSSNENNIDLDLTELVIKVIKRPNINFLQKICSLNSDFKRKVNLKSLDLSDCEQLFKIVIALEDLQFIQSLNFVNFILECLLFKRNNVKITKQMKELIREIRAKSYQQYRLVNELQKQYQVFI